MAEKIEGRVSECVSEQMKLSEQHSGTGCYLLLHALSFDLLRAAGGAGAERT